MKLENDLGQGSVPRLVWRIALPSMLAQFVSVLYSIIDRMYIGHIPEIGSAALAGVGVCGPVVTMIGAAAFWVGVGGSPIMSMRMGEERLDAARKILSNAVLLLILFSVLLTALGLLLKRPMLYLFGASDSIYPHADAYFTVYVCGTLFSLLATGLNQFIICQGFARVSMLSVMIGAVCNILLDPLFIFTFHMGVAGAAVATVISQAVSCVFVLRFLFHRDIPVPISFKGYSIRIIRQILAIGFAPFIIIAIDNVMVIAMNAVLQQYGGPEQGDRLITTATIVQSLMLVITMPLGGISGGTQTILGYNYGARRLERVHQAQRWIIGLCVAYTTLMFVLSWLAGPLFIRLFTQDPSLTETTMRAIRIFTLAIIPLGIQYELVDGFTAIGKVGLSLPLSFFRKVVYFLAVFLFPMWWGAEAVFFAEPLSDIIGPFTSIIVHRFMMPRILRRRALSAPAKNTL